MTSQGQPNRLNRRASAYWSRERIIAAIVSYELRYGDPPSARDWNPAQAVRDGRDDIAKRFYEDGCWPFTTTVLRVFGKWSTAMIAAGCEPRGVGQRGPTTKAKR